MKHTWMAAAFVILSSYSIAATNGGGDCDDVRIFGYTAAGKLIRFDDDKPLFAWSVGTVSGLAGDTALVGIDYRPADGKLYGLGNAGGVYTINTFNAVATFKSQLDVALSGTSFGVDFNPTVDRLRVVSDNGQNLRVNVDTGATTTDTALNYTGPAALGIAGAAYTNNDADPNTATTLYDIDTMLDQAAIQAPPNSGTLNPTGKLLVDTTQDVGFDIYSRMDNGNIVETLGFAALRVGTRSRLYRIDLFTGKARLRGSFASHHQVVGLAIPLDQ